MSNEKSKTFLSECVSIPVYASIHGHGPEWAYNQVKRGLPVVHIHDGRGGQVIHLPTADAYHQSKLRSKGRKLVLDQAS